VTSVIKRPKLVKTLQVRKGLPQLHWAVPAVFAPWAWVQTGEPAHLKGLAAGAAVVVLLWPLMLMLMVFGPYGLAGLLVPREWRARHRYGRPRPAIPARLERVVRGAYGHRCLYCHLTDTDLRRAKGGRTQVEHVMPWSRGGLNSLWNLTLLCPKCNKIKSDYWVYRNGRRPYYNPWDGYANQAEAAKILRAERKAHHQPGLWLGIAWRLAL
jgi:hypothetical protein